MRVFVAGASGAIGRPLVRRLLAAGHEVTGSTRSPERAEAIRALGADAVTVDVFDGDALHAVMAEAAPDVVVHELTALSKPPLRVSGLDLTNRLRSEGSRNLVAVAQEIGARRFVTQSIVFGYGFSDHGDEVLAEDAPFGKPEGKSTDGILSALVAAEALAGEAGEGIALRYGLLYGGDAPNIVPLLRRRMVPVTQGGVLGWVHHDDAAAATVAAVERGAPGAYNVVDDQPATFEQMFTAMAEAIGAPRPWRLPRWLLSLVAPYVVAFGMDTQLRVSNEKAARELGWRPRYPSYREGIEAMAEALHEASAGAPADAA